MGIESGDFSPDAEGGIGQVVEKASETAREQASSKALAGIARSRKDESKGRKASDLLSSMLVSLLRDPRFDPLLEPTMSLLRLDFPAAYVVGILSLVSSEASAAVRKTFDPSAVSTVSDPSPETNRAAFDPDRLRADFRHRINEWIADVFLVATKDPSYVLTDKFLSIIRVSKTRSAYLSATEAVLTYFFDSKNIEVPHSEAKSFAIFLLKELESRIESLNRRESV